MTRTIKSILLGLLLTGAVSAGLAAATDNAPPSAQSLLFDANYLAPLGAPSRIVYDYSSKTADPALFGKSFDDEVAMRLTPSADGSGEKEVTLDMFTGSRQHTVGPLTRVSGNPIIMMFLERDVSEMNMHVGGQPVYFRNVIRLAFREKAKLEPATITWEGKPVPATKITIQPFLGDPNGERMQLFKSKTYEFLVSDAVPGGIYQMHSTIGDARPDAPPTPAIEIKMTLKGITYDQPQN
jgi:hypothetical protein